MKTTLTNFALGLMLGVSIATAADEPLPSWNDGPAKQSILAFVEKVTKEGSPDFVPVPERIAVFDNDGTLWAEQPAYTQLQFLIDRIKALAPEHPEWKTKEPFASLLKGDLNGVAAQVRRVGRTDGGHTLGYDHRGVQQDSERLDRNGEASEDRQALYRNGFINRCSNCSPTSARTGSRPSLSRVAALNSCARGPKRFTAFRPSKSSAAPAD